MIERTFDAAFFNEICNLPEVRPWLGGEGPIDTAPVLANPANYALRAKNGGFILIAHGAGSYSVHTQFSSEGRGAEAAEAMRAGLDFMFTRTDCMQIHSLCPDLNPSAAFLAMKGGAKKWFRKAADALLGPGQVVRWDIEDWAVSEPSLEADGQAFHELLEAAKAKAGSDLTTHADDPWHDRMVGAVIRMTLRGQVTKGIALYNRWAAAAGYAPVTLLSEAPPLVDVGDGIVGLNTNGELEILACR